jgi:hypothetical protein
LISLKKPLSVSVPILLEFLSLVSKIPWYPQKTSSLEFLGRTFSISFGSCSDNLTKNVLISSEVIFLVVASILWMPNSNL